MKKYPLEFRTEEDFKWYSSDVVQCEQAVQLNNIANEIGAMNEGLDSILVFSKLLLPLLEEALKESK